MHAIGRDWVDPPTGLGFRPLTTGERRRVLRDLRRRWPPIENDWWHPRDAVQGEADVLCLESDWLEKNLPLDVFRRRALLRCSTFWVIGEGTPRWDNVGSSYQGEYEISASYLCLTPSSEMIVAPRNLDWMAYTDHNHATYLIGAWLVDAVKELWSAWDQHIWTTPFHEHPPDSRRQPWWVLGAPI